MLVLRRFMHCFIFTCMAWPWQQEDGELLLAEAQEETNAVRAELAKQAEKTKQLQQALSQKAKEVTELRRHIPTG